MKALARAVINAAAYLELSDEEQVDPDFAMQALEEIAYSLSHCGEDEKEALVQVLAEMRTAEVENQTRPEMLEFLDTFLATFGLASEDEIEDDGPSRMNLL